MSKARSVTATVLVLASVAATLLVFTPVPANVLRFVRPLEPPRVIQLDTGLVQGTFIGIPFAKPPVGDLRFAEPQPAEAWNGVLQASTYKPACVQHCTLPFGLCPGDEGTSEDCLYLNVWTPPGTTANDNLPVMYWIYGGGFRTGSAASTLYHGDRLAKLGPVIVVSANYRLGPFGWVRTKHTSGNMGFHDQQLGLKWVQANIAKFGGDAKRVTIFGESAGGTSVAAHLMAPGSKSLFHRAIAQSHPWAVRFKDLASAHAIGYDFADAIGCSESDTACMRSKSVEEVRAAGRKATKHVFPAHLSDMGEPWSPVYDGHDIKHRSFVGLDKRDWNHVPLVIGNTEQEAAMATWEMGPLPSYKFVPGIEAAFRTDGPAILKQYPWKNKDDVRPEATRLGTDFVFGCSGRHAAELASAVAPAWLYHHNQTISFGAKVWGKFTWCVKRTCHGTELPFVFDTVSEVHPDLHWTAKEAALVRQMQSYWINLAYTGDVNKGPHKPHVEWPKHVAGQGTTMVMEAPQPRPVPHLQDDICAFWDGIGYDKY